MQRRIIEDIANLENLHWAWQKLKSAYKNAADIWLNQIEVECFEGELEENLLSIQKEILSGSYTLQPLNPVAYPKTKGENGPRTRPAFYVNVKDQVAWIAVIRVCL